MRHKNFYESTVRDGHELSKAIVQRKDIICELCEKVFKEWIV